MAPTAKPKAFADLFASRDVEEYLNADRILTATPAIHWIWPFKKFIPAYQLHKGRSYQREGQKVLRTAEASNEPFRQGPAEGLREELTYVIEDLQDLYQNPESMTKKASRRYKHRARNNFNKIVISSEAFEARGTYHLSVGARDDTGMPSSIATVATRSSSQDSPPKHPAIEPRAPVPQAHLLPRLELAGSKTDHDPALEGTIAWRLAQLSIVQEDPEESYPPCEGLDDDPSARGLGVPFQSRSD